MPSKTTATADAILETLRSTPGAVRQTDLVRGADVSKATVSRALTHLEDHGHIVRLQIAGHNRVWLADDAPGVIET